MSGFAWMEDVIVIVVIDRDGNDSGDETVMPLHVRLTLRAKVFVRNQVAIPATLHVEVFIILIIKISILIFFKRIEVAGHLHIVSIFK